jgi:hypothetical protein
MDTESFFPLVAVSAAALVGGIALFQSDRISRHILSNKTLDKKRRGEYVYQWKTAIDATKLQLEYYLAGGITMHGEDPERVMKNTTFLSDEADMDDLIGKILDKEKTAIDRYYALKIDKDSHDPTDDYYVFLAHEEYSAEGVSRNNTCSSSRILLYELPLIKFGMKLCQAFEDQLTTTTLCFVADASSGKASSMLEGLVKAAKTGVAVLSEPFWMVQLALLAETSILSSSKIQKLFFALCRLDAWSVRNQMGEAKTVMITLPGQATIRTLLPLTVAVFPEERHVFSYDGCVASVQRGIYGKKTYQRGKLRTTLSKILCGLCDDPVREATPMPSNSPLTKDATLSTLPTALANISVQYAQVVESWMSSVDAYFKLKQQEKSNGYLPYCFKVGFLVDNPKGNFEPRTDSFWSLSSLLQFITGCRSRPLPEGGIDAAKEWLKDYNQHQFELQERINKVVAISEHERQMIENCCFQHKLILIGNKTLQDTVLPKEHWTLKQAVRAGCSCCDPDPYEQMQDEDQDGDESKHDRSASFSGSPGPLAMVFTADQTTNGYVDGKMSFAFDPTRF